jgi:hypothetical protein
VSAATSFVKNALAFFLQYKKFVNSKPQKNMEKDQYIIFTQTKSTSSWQLRDSVKSYKAQTNTITRRGSIWGTQETRIRHTTQCVLLRLFHFNTVRWVCGDLTAYKLSLLFSFSYHNTTNHYSSSVGHWLQTLQRDSWLCVSLEGKNLKGSEFGSLLHISISGEFRVDTRIIGLETQP